jgi:hypothetical protein
VSPFVAAVNALVAELYPGKVLTDLDPAVQVEVLRAAGAKCRSGPAPGSVTYLASVPVDPPAVLGAAANPPDVHYSMIPPTHQP